MAAENNPHAKQTQPAPSLDDDSFLDWETRDEAFPFHKHIVAGKEQSPLEEFRYGCTLTSNNHENNIDDR